MKRVNTPLSNIQIELLKVFDRDIPDEYLIDIKKIIANYLMGKARDKADKDWEEKDYTDSKLRQLLLKK